LALSPFNNQGVLRVSAEKICDYFLVTPEDVWSPEQLTVLETNRREVEIGYRDLYRLDNQHDPVLAIESDQLKGSIEEMLSHLTPREREIIKLRFGLEGEVVTFAELGKRFNVTSARVNAIERFALSKIRLSNYSEVNTRLQAFEELKEEWMVM
jgi:RNA polymerase sigma factor (sigma-70 family)